MQYKIKPGIAACCKVITDQKEFYCIYYGQGEIQVDIHNDPKFETFPVEVQEAVKQHFAAVFSLPLESREQYLKAHPEWTVESSAS